MTKTKHWTRWINPFAETELHEYRVRLVQILFLFALGAPIPFVLSLFVEPTASVDQKMDRCR